MQNKHLSSRSLLALLSVLVPMWLIQMMPVESAFFTDGFSPSFVLLVIFSNLTLSLIMARL